MSLDPSDWDGFRALGRRMVDDMLTYQQTVRERAPWQPVPEAVRARLEEPLPRVGMPLEEVYESFRRDILPYPTGNAHPRFFGWVMANGTPTGMLADMLAAGMNPHLAGYDQSAAVVELQVVRWLAQSMGYPAEASGLLVSGGTAANFNGLLAARVAKAGFDIRAHGLNAGPPLAVYASSETHNWAVKAVETLGMGREALRKVPVDADYRIDLAACRAAILSDLEAGWRPIALVGNAGTVNTGAIDDFSGLRALADEFELWLHIDGAFGSMAAWSASRAIVKGQERADSLAFDLHKWGYLPYEVGAVLTRDSGAQVAAFGGADKAAPAYLLSADAGVAKGTTYFADRGLQLSRGFRALKLWMSLKEQGIERIGAHVQKNIDQARYLAGRVDAEPELELMAPVALNIVCLRYRGGHGTDAELDLLNREILIQLQLRGIAVPSQTILNGRFAIRACITNHRTEQHDLDTLLEGVLTLGRELSADA